MKPVTAAPSRTPQSALDEPPEIPRSLVEWLWRVYPGALPDVDLRKGGPNPAEYIALACQRTLGQLDVVHLVTAVYRTQQEKAKGTPPSTTRRRRR